MELTRLLTEIEVAEIRYVIVGGIAVNLHGVIRPTHDLDLVVYLADENLKKFLDLMKKLGFKPKPPLDPLDLIDESHRQDWAKNRNMVVFSFHHPDNNLMEVDLFVEHPLPFEEIYSRRDLVRIGDYHLSVWGSRI